MSLTQTKQYITSNNWYRQAAAAKWLYFSYPLHSCYLFRIRGKKIPVHYKAFVYGKRDFFHLYFIKNALKEVAFYYFKKQIRDLHFIGNLFKSWRYTYYNSLTKKVTHILEADLSYQSNKQLLQSFADFSKLYASGWSESIFHDGFDLWGEAMLQAAIEKENKQIDPHDLNILLMPSLPSVLQREENELLNILQRFGKYPSLKKELEQHAKKYHFMHSDFAIIEHLDSMFFYKKIRQWRKDRQLLSQKQKELQELSSIVKEKRATCKKYRLSQKFISTIEFFSTLQSWRDERKAYAQLANAALFKFALEISLRTKLNLNTIEYMFYWEMKDVFNLTKKRINLINKRVDGAFYVLTGSNSMNIFLGSAGKNLMEFIETLLNKQNKLEGRAAYPGLVAGIVKIIKDRRDFHKMKRGDVLVAPNTRPEYVPIMKLASAIISEEGGITCHSSIVSRELKIPCIVGIQGATTLLRDGELIEVNANKGTVMKIDNII